MFDKKVAEKLHKPRRKDAVTEILRTGVKQLERYRHPKLLTVLHGVEESAESLAFASEPLMGSLANILQPVDEKQSSYYKCEYKFLDVELKYGMLQVSQIPVTQASVSGYIIFARIYACVFMYVSHPLTKSITIKSRN